MMSHLTRRLRPSSVVEAIGMAVLVVASVLAIVSGAAAHEAKVGDLVLHHPWARATPAGAKVGGGFMTIRNTGTEPDRLVSGSVGFAERVEIHEMAMEGDVMRMRPLTEGLEIPAGGEVVLKPGSFHIMFMGLKGPLSEGERVEGTLVFEKAGPVQVEFAVEALGAGAGADMDHGADGHESHGSHN